MEKKDKRSFLTTLPGILTGIAAVIGAITSLYVATKGPGDNPVSEVQQPVSAQTPVTVSSPDKLYFEGKYCTPLKDMLGGCPVKAVGVTPPVYFQFERDGSFEATWCNLEQVTGVYEILGKDIALRYSYLPAENAVVKTWATSGKGEEFQYGGSLYSSKLCKYLRH